MKSQGNMRKREKESQKIRSEIKGHFSVTNPTLVSLFYL